MYKKSIFVCLILFSLVLVFFLASISVEAEEPISSITSRTETAPVTLCDPLTDKCGGAGLKPQVLIGRVIRAVLGIVGSLALVMFVYGGLVWMTSAGNNEKVTKGKNILIWATIGLIIIFTSYMIVKIIFTDILGLS